MKFLWKCHSVTCVEKQDVVLQMKKLRPSEICWPVEAPQPSLSPLTGCLGPAGSVQGQQGTGPGEQGLLSAA